MPELRDILAEAVPPGALVACGGGELQRKPMAALRTLVELGVGDLRVATMLGSADVEVLLGSGAVTELHSAGVALEGLAPRWREARQTGAPTVVEWSEGTFAAALQAAALGLDSIPWPAGLGTDLPAINPWLKEATDPHTGRAVLAVRALVPDVALIHVNGLDAEGNAYVDGGSRRRRAARARLAARRRHLRAPRRVRPRPRRDLAPLDRRRRRGGRRRPSDRLHARLRARQRRAGRAVIADLLTGTLAEEIAAAPIRVFVPTTPATGVAARAAGVLGNERLALSQGFTALTGDSRDWAMDVFTLLRRGLLGVAVAPVQLDAAGRTNLSGVGTPGRPKVALIGPRGLTENNDTPCPLWYLLAQHSPRALVERVDIVCGAAPSSDAGPRTLLTPAGCFDLADGRWVARWLAPGGSELIAGAPDFAIEIPDGVTERSAPSSEALAALAAVDPDGTRRAEFGE